MFKYVAGVMALVCGVALCSAQKSEGKYSLYGRSIDSFTHETVDSAVVTLLKSDSVTVLGKDTIQGREWGYFVFKLDESGNYLLRFEAKNYKTELFAVKARFSKVRKAMCDLGVFKLHKMAMTDRTMDLKEVVVTGSSRIKMVMHGDTIVYNAAAFQLAQGSMLDALVKQLPGVEIKDNGKIYVNGKFVESLLVNGKDFFKGDVKIALDNLPAYTVGNIKIYKRESDQMKALGIRDTLRDDVPTVMDVNLKRIYSIGWLANVDLGMGTHNRYSGKLFALRFSDYSRLVLYGSVNNASDTSTPGDDGNWQSMDVQSGLRSYKTAGIQTRIDDRQKRFNYTGTATYEHTNTDNWTETTSTNFLAGGDTYARLRSLNKDKETRLKTTHEFSVHPEGGGYYFEFTPQMEYYDYKRPYQSFSSNLNGNPQEAYRGAALDSIFTIGASDYMRRLMVNRQQTEQRGQGHSLTANTGYDVNIKIPGTNDDVFTWGTMDYKNATDKTYSLSDLRYMKDGAVTSNDYRRQFTDSPVKQFSGDYSFGYNMRIMGVKNWMILFMPRYEYSHSYDHSPRSLYRLDKLSGWGSGSTQGITQLPSATDSMQQALDFDNSYFSTRRDYTHKGVVQLYINHELKNKWNLGLISGLVASFQKNALDYRRGEEGTDARIDTTLSRHVNFLNPNVTLNAIKSDNKGRCYISLRYSLSQSAPDVLNLLSIHDTSNPLVQRVPNTNVKNTKEHHVSLNANKFTITTGEDMNLYVNYIVTPNSLCQAMTYDKTTGVTTYKPDNVNGNWNISGGFTYARPLDKAKHFTIQSNTSSSYNHSVDKTGVGSGTESVRSVVNNTIASEELTAQYERKKYRIGVSGNVNYTHATSSREGFTTINCADVSYGVAGQAPLPWDMEVSSDLKMYSRRGYEDHTMNTNQLVWNAQLTKSLMKGKMQFKLDGYDILHKLTAVTRTLTAQGRTEVWNNVVPSYVMMHLVYKFNLQPKNKKKEEKKEAES
jgi:hypothetical protein